MRARLVGLNVTALYGLAFAIAASLAGLAGIFMGGYRFMNPSMGADPLLKAQSWWFSAVFQAFQDRSSLPT